jgi:hypothetical protein
MALVGLPGTMGFVWATGMFAGLYGGLLVLINLLPTIPLTVAQTTIIASMILISHSFPTELTIVKKSGMRVWFSALFRIGSALIYGKILSLIYPFFSSLQVDNRNFEFVQSQSATLMEWVISQIKFLLIIYLILFALTVFLKVIDRLGITSAINRLLYPVMKLIGIGKTAIPITVIGVVMGLTYGGGMIQIEANSGRINSRDIFFSIALMCIFHSLFEDTFTASLFGTDLFGILWGRLIFSFLMIFILKQIVDRMPDKIFEKYLYKLKTGKANS